jgi:hypothetical protein
MYGRGFCRRRSLGGSLGFFAHAHRSRERFKQPFETPQSSMLFERLQTGKSGLAGRGQVAHGSANAHKTVERGTKRGRPVPAWHRDHVNSGRGRKDSARGSAQVREQEHPTR